jgi:hypothetical protein
MAPEVIQKQPGNTEHYSFYADIFALAVTLWEILNRQ